MEKRPFERGAIERRSPGERVSFLTCSCAARAHLLSEPRARTALAEHLERHAAARTVAVHAWVVMSNHVHLLVSSAAMPVVDWIRDWKRDSVAHLRAIDSEWLPSEGRSGRFWLKGLGYDRDIWSWQEYFEKLDYIELNPVSARLAARCAEYEWSSAFDRGRVPREGYPTLAPPPDWLVDLLG